MWRLWWDVAFAGHHSDLILVWTNWNSVILHLNWSPYNSLNIQIYFKMNHTFWITSTNCHFSREVKVHPQYFWLMKLYFNLKFCLLYKTKIPQNCVIKILISKVALETFKQFSPEAISLKYLCVWADQNGENTATTECSPISFSLQPLLSIHSFGDN